MASVVDNDGTSTKSLQTKENDVLNCQDIPSSQSILSTQFEAGGSRNILYTELSVREPGVVYFDSSADFSGIREDEDCVVLETGKERIMQCARFPIANLGKKKSCGSVIGNLRSQRNSNKGKILIFC